MEIHFKIIGVLLMLLAIIHVLFPKYFNWKQEFQSVSLINRQMMFVHTFFIALVVFLMGLLCLMSSTDLIETKLGQTITFGFGIFWSARLFTQIFVYSKDLWKGKTFETIMHVFFLLLWTYLSLVFILTATNR